MTYDRWKTMSPDDERGRFYGEDRPSDDECDCVEQVPPAVEQIDEQPLPLKWQLFAAFVACSCTAAIGFGWAYLLFGVAQ